MLFSFDIKLIILGLITLSILIPFLLQYRTRIIYTVKDIELINRSKYQIKNKFKLSCNGQSCDALSLHEVTIQNNGKTSEENAYFPIEISSREIVIFYDINTDKPKNINHSLEDNKILLNIEDFKNNEEITVIIGCHHSKNNNIKLKTKTNEFGHTKKVDKIYKEKISRTIVSLLMFCLIIFTMFENYELKKENEAKTNKQSNIQVVSK